jgi:diacylglycerol kinase family enzyme
MASQRPERGSRTSERPSGPPASGAGLAIIHNPQAGREGVDVERLRALVRGRGAVFSTEEEGLVDAVAEGAAERGVQTVGVIGGDGTAGRVLRALHTAFGDAPMPRIALLRGGTMNTLANAIEVPKLAPERLLERLVQRPGLPVYERATLRVDGRLGFLFSAGIMSGFLETLYAEGRGDAIQALGLLARGSLETLFGGKLLRKMETPLTATLSLDGEREPTRRYVALGAGTVETVGLGFRPYPRTTERLDRFQAFAFHGSVQTLARELPRIRRGQRVAPELGLSPLVQTLEIDAEPEQTNFTYALDGDLHQARSPLRVELGPTVRLVAL